MSEHARPDEGADHGPLCPISNRKQNMAMFTENVLVGFALTLFAGLATGIGSLLAILGKRTNVRRKKAFAYSFLSGVAEPVEAVTVRQIPVSRLPPKNRSPSLHC